MKPSPLVCSDLPIQRRIDQATRLVQQLCEHLLLGGTLRAWQVSNLLRALSSLWERHTHREQEARDWAARRYEREHWQICASCGGLGVVNRAPLSRGNGKPPAAPQLQSEAK